jgi:hypothetical protein
MLRPHKAFLLLLLLLLLLLRTQDMMTIHLRMAERWCCTEANKGDYYYTHQKGNGGGMMMPLLELLLELVHS